MLTRKPRVDRKIINDFGSKSFEDDDYFDNFTSIKFMAFLKITENTVVKDFLNHDMCCVLADKYLIAITFSYFLRAELQSTEYTAMNFFIALYLSHDVEEDLEELKDILLHWALGYRYSAQTVEQFMKEKQEFWIRMRYKAIVPKTLCNKIFSLIPYHRLWERERSASHSGAIREYETKKFMCNNCQCYIFPHDSNNCKICNFSFYPRENGQKLLSNYGQSSFEEDSVWYDQRRQHEDIYLPKLKKLKCRKEE